MGRMKELLMSIEDECGQCKEAKCEGCKMCLDIGDKIVYVAGKTKKILRVEMKSKLANTGTFVLSCMRVCIVLCLLAGSAMGDEIVDISKLADAIYIAEGGSNTSHPYGILKHYKTTTPRQACINTIKHGLRDFKGGDFISFLGSRYCPVGCDNDNGTNKYWVKNVKALYKKEMSK